MTGKDIDDNILLARNTEVKRAKDLDKTEQREPNVRKTISKEIQGNQQESFKLNQTAIKS